MNDTLNIFKFETRSKAEDLLSNHIVENLRADISLKGEASLIVSGGSTPISLFKKLSKTELDWAKVVVSLADDRILPEWHQDFNGRMVKENLLTHHASKATFVSLVNDSNDKLNNLRLAKDQLSEIPQPFTAVILGMGEDGHTASLFSGSENYNQAMSMTTELDLFNVTPNRAPYDRITFGRRKLLEAQNLYLHFYGNSKMTTLVDAIESCDMQQYPIAGFLASEHNIQTIWAS